MAKSTNKASSSRTPVSPESIPVKGGWVVRDRESSKLIEVRGATGVSRASERSEEVAGAASARRSEALKRLADR